MSVEVEQLQKEQSENVAKQENDEVKKRGTNKMPPSSTNPNTLFKKGRISREEWIKLTRQKKKVQFCLYNKKSKQFLIWYINRNY